MGGGFVGLAGVYFAWWSATTIFGPRYWYEALPFLLLLSGRGLVVLGRGVAALARPAPRLRVGLVLLLVIGPLLLYNGAQTLPAQVRAYTGYNDVDASSLQAVAAAHLDHALVFVGLERAFGRRDFGKVFFCQRPAAARSRRLCPRSRCGPQPRPVRRLPRPPALLFAPHRPPTARTRPLTSADCGMVGT